MSRLIRTVCFGAFFILANGKAFGNILLNVTVTDVSSAALDYSKQLILRYNGEIEATPSGGTAPYVFILVPPSGENIQQNNAYFPNLDAGTYYLTVTDANGQTTTNKVMVSYKYPQPAVTVSNVNIPTACTNDGSFTLTGSGGTPPYSFSIDGGITFTPNINFANLAQADYVIVIKDANGQIALIGTNPTSAVVPGFIGLYGTFCDVGGSAQFSQSACTNQGVLHASIFSETQTSFSLDGINFQPLTLSTIIPGLYQYDSSGLSPGLYNFYLKNLKGELSVYTYVIVKFCPIQSVFAAVDASCGQSNGSLTITASGGVPPYTYSMDGINYQTSNLFPGLSSGNYAVTVKDATGLTGSSTGTLYDDCPISVRLTSVNAACGIQKGSVIVGVKGGLPPYTYSIDGVLFQSSDTLSNLSPTNYTITVKDNSGLSGTATATILSEPAPQLSATPDASTCAGNDGGIGVIVTGGTSPYQYSLNGGIIYQDSAGFAGIAPGPYTVSIKDANGCTASESVTVPLNKTPVKVFAGHDTSVLINQPLLLHAVDVDNSGFIQYQWSPPVGLNNPDIQDPIATLSQSTQYTVTATTASGCEGTAGLSIKVFTTSDLYVPGAFTPNGDGHNDLLRVVPVGMKEFKYFAVYNRHGQRVFYTTDPSTGWDGTLKGNPQMTGAYVWTAAGINYTGARIDRKGTVILVR